MTQDWKTIVLMALNGSGVNESEAIMQVRVIEPMMEEYLKEERNAVLSDIKEGLVLLRKHDGERYALDKNLDYSKGVGETLTKVSEILELIKHE